MKAALFLSCSMVSCLVPVVFLLLSGRFNLIFTTVFLIFARLAYKAYEVELINFRRSTAGSEAEDETGRLLALLPEGWRVEANVPVAGCGDADFLLVSPANRAFVVEVKAHRGRVLFDGRQLIREHRGSKAAFERDFLLQLQRLVGALKERYGSGIVPVLVFSKAKVQLPQRKLCDVHVVETSELLTFLQSYDGIV